MRIVNGPIIMTREERMKIVHEIKERILDKYGDDVCHVNRGSRVQP